MEEIHSLKDLNQTDPERKPIEVQATKGRIKLPYDSDRYDFNQALDLIRPEFAARGLTANMGAYGV